MCILARAYKCMERIFQGILILIYNYVSPFTGLVNYFFSSVLLRREALL